MEFRCIAARKKYLAKNREDPGKLLSSNQSPIAWLSSNLLGRKREAIHVCRANRVTLTLGAEPRTPKITSMQQPKTIFAMGGGGFLMEPENPRLDRYIVKLTGKNRPKVCHFPHATSDPNPKVVEFYRTFTQLGAEPSFLSLFALPTADLEDFILSQDAIYVGGGNTKSMLALWREWELDRILKKAYEEGVILAGVSAGANCWFESCTTDSIPGAITALPCLGLLKGSFTPHMDGEAERRPTVHRLLREGKLPPGYAADDGAAIHFQNGLAFQCVSSRLHAKVYQLEIHGGKIREEPLSTEYLP